MKSLKTETSDQQKLFPLIKPRSKLVRRTLVTPFLGFMEDLS